MIEECTSLVQVRDICVYYDSSRNCFTTVDGKRIMLIYPLVPPGIVSIFRYKKENMVYVNYTYNIRVFMVYDERGLKC